MAKQRYYLDTRVLTAFFFAAMPFVAFGSFIVVNQARNQLRESVGHQPRAAGRPDEARPGAVRGRAGRAPAGPRPGPGGAEGPGRSPPPRPRGRRASDGAGLGLRQGPEAQRLAPRHAARGAPEAPRPRPAGGQAGPGHRQHGPRPGRLEPGGPPLLRRGRVVQGPGHPAGRRRGVRGRACSGRRARPSTSSRSPSRCGTRKTSGWARCGCCSTPATSTRCSPRCASAGRATPPSSARPTASSSPPTRASGSSRCRSRASSRCATPWRASRWPSPARRSSGERACTAATGRCRR